MKKRILVVEDDEHLALGLRINLELEGYEPVSAPSAEEALLFLRKGGIDLVLLDVMLPGMNGFELCRRIRAERLRVPVLFLTARGAEEDRVRGLEEGGDDYMVKPFSLKELLARVKGIFRREEWHRTRPEPEILVLGEARVNLATGEAETPAGPRLLKAKEVLILRLLAEYDGRPVPRHTILDRVWGYTAHPTPRTVDNFIVRLRRVLEPDPAKPRFLLTVHGTGYRLAR